MSKGARVVGMDKKLYEYCKEVKSKYSLNKSILLVQLPQFNIQGANKQGIKQRGYYAYPPFGLMTLESAMNSKDVEINIVDLNLLVLKEVMVNDDFNIERDWLGLLDKYIEKCNPSIIGVTTISVSVNPDDQKYHLTQFLKKYSEQEKYILIAGGPNVSDNYKYYLENNLCSFVVTKEGEAKFNMLIDYLYNNIDQVCDVSGVMYYSGKVKSSVGHSNSIAVKNNIIPSYKKINIEEYNLYGSLNPFSRMAGVDKHFSTIQLNRGCRADCKFCGVTEFMGKGVRTAPPELVIDEMEYLVRERNVNHIEFLDDDLLGGGVEGKEAAISLLQHMAELREEFDITWSAGNGLVATSIDKELLQLFEDSGCIGFRIGIESANPDMLKQLRKPANLSRLLNVGKIINNHPKIFAGANYIIGLFGVETFGQILDTFNFSRKLSLDWSSYSTYQFTNKDNAERKQIKTDGKSANEFVPVKNTSAQQVTVDGIAIEKGMDIFSIDKNTIPSREQVDEIWFAFNLLANYIYNKNFMRGGNHIKIVKWIQAAMMPYPSNPYMPLFAGLGLLMMDDRQQADTMFLLSQKRVSDSAYWKERFVQFHLDEVLKEKPSSSLDAFQLVEHLQKTLKV